MNESSENKATSSAEVTDEPRFVIVRGSGRGLSQEVIVGRHRLTADEPDPVGTDTGPTPYDLLVAALGTCTSMTLQLYAQRKAWPLETVNVVLRHGRIHATDGAECETKDGKVNHIERAIELGGPLTEEQRSRLLEIAEKCPVRRTLESEIDIQTRLV